MASNKENKVKDKREEIEGFSDSGEEDVKNLREEKDHLKSPEELAEEAEVTSDDLQALGPKDFNLDISQDIGEDELLRQREQGVDFTGHELDIPGSELDDQQEDIGSEDEENNHYSLGADKEDDLERGD